MCPVYLPSGIRDELEALQFQNKASDDIDGLNWEQQSLDQISRLSDALKLPPLGSETSVPARAVSTPSAPVYEAPAQMPLTGPRRQQDPMAGQIRTAWRPDVPQTEQQGGQPAPTAASALTPASSAAPAASGMPQAMPSQGSVQLGASVSDGSPPGPITGDDRPSRIASALPHAQAAEARTGVPADVNLAFAVHESGLEDRYGPGMSYHGRHAVGDEPGTPINDWGYDARGNRVDYPTKLKSYQDASGSFSDFADLISNSPRYQPALQRYQQSGDKAQLVRDIWAAGYGESKTGPDETVNILQNQTAPAASQPVGGASADRRQSVAGSSAPSSSGGWEVDQAALDDPDKWSLCGPVAAVMAATKRGAAWTVGQAKKIAMESGLWNADQGMGGLSTEVSLLNKLGVAATTGAADAQHLAADALAGNTPIISTAKHYFILKGYDPATGKFDTTTSGVVLRGGSRYLTLDEIERLGGGIQGAAYIDNPSSPVSSVAAPPTAGAGPSAPAGSPLAPPAPNGDASPSGAGGSNYKLGADLPDMGQSAGAQKRARLAAVNPYDPRPDDQGQHELSPNELLNNSQNNPGANIHYLPPGSPLESDQANEIEMPIGPRPAVAMQRQPLGPTQGPDSGMGQEYDPRAADEGRHEWQSPSAGTTSPVTESASSADGSPPSPADPATYGASGDEQQQAPYQPPAAPQPTTPPPGLQAVYDAGGNFLHWIQGAAQGAADQIGQNMAGNRQAVTDANAATGAPAASPLGESINAIAGGATSPEALDAAIQAAMQAYNDPLYQGLSGPARAAYIVSQTSQAYGDAAARKVAETLGVSDDAVVTILGHPISRRDVFGFAGASLADPTQYVGGGHADPLMATARGLTNDVIKPALGSAGRGIRGALDANATRVAAADARMAEQGSTVAPSILGPITGVDRGPDLRGRVIPPHVSDTLDFPVRVPTDPNVVRAIEAAGGSVDPERGVNLNVIRMQGPEAAGKPATRSSTFYTAGKPGEASPYAAGEGAQVGGSERIEAPTTYRSPLVLSDAPGSTVGFDSGMRTLTADRAEEITAARQHVTDTHAAYAAEQSRNARPNIVLSRLADQWGEAKDALSRLLPSARLIDNEIDMARRAGPPGSPARAQALKELVTRYGGDPSVIDDLLSLRGADDSESAWAIKENILAHNARARGYDGVLTIGPRPVPEADLVAHPAVQTAAATEQAAWQGFEAANRDVKDVTRRYQSRGMFPGPDSPTAQDVQAARSRAEEAYQAVQSAQNAHAVARDAARSELGDAHISELADFRESHNPTPGKISSDVEQAYEDASARSQQAYKAQQDAEAAHQAQPNAANWRAYQQAEQELTDARQAWHQARTALDDAEKTPGPPGYTLRSDLPRRATGEPPTTTAPAAVGPAAPSGPGALAQVNTAAGNAIRGAATGGVTAAMTDPGSPQGENESNADYAMRRVRERAQRVAAGAGIGAAGFVAGGALLPRGAGGALQMAGPQGQAPQIAGLTAGQNAAVQQALTGAQKRAANMTLRGLSTPSAWDWLKAAGYSGIYSPATAVSSAIGGAQELVLAQPKEALRALVEGRPVVTGAQAARQVKAAGEGIANLGRVLLGDAGASGAASGGSRGTAGVSGRVVNPAGHLAARALERPGEILTEAPDAVFRPQFRAQGEAREASRVASQAGVPRGQRGAYAEQLMQDAEAVRGGQLPTMPETQRVVDAGEKYADDLGFKGKPGAFGQYLGKLAHRDDAIGVAASFLMPFPSMASRMTGAAIKSTPGAALIPGVRKMYPSKFDMIYDQGLGAVAASGMAYWAMNGGITGSGPADKGKRDEMIAQGWQPNSVLIAGHYIPNRMFGRFQAFLDTAGEFHDGLAYGKDRTAPQITAELVKRGSKIATDQVGLSGLADLHDMLENGFSSQFPGWAARSATRYMPYGGVLRAAAASLDPNQRRADPWREGSPLPAIGEQMKVALPGLRQTVPAAQDILGRPMENPQQGLGAVIPRTTTMRNDPIINLFQDAGVSIGSAHDQMTVGRTSGVPLKPAEQRRWNEARGQFVQDYADAYTSNPDFMALPPAQKEKYLKTFLGKAADYADKIVQSEADTEDLTTRTTDQAMKKAVGQ